jgi:hypothetical protein
MLFFRMQKQFQHLDTKTSTDAQLGHLQSILSSFGSFESDVAVSDTLICP